MIARHPDEVLMIPFDKEVPNYSMIRMKKKSEEVL